MKKTCPVCQREVASNLDGNIRRHWCLPEVGDSKAMTFATGGSLRVRLDANWMLFGEAERALLNTIIDAMDAYEREHATKDLAALLVVEGGARPQETDERKNLTRVVSVPSDPPLGSTASDNEVI